MSLCPQGTRGKRSVIRGRARQANSSGISGKGCQDAVKVRATYYCCLLHSSNVFHLLRFDPGPSSAFDAYFVFKTWTAPGREGGRVPAARKHRLYVCMYVCFVLMTRSLRAWGGRGGAYSSLSPRTPQIKTFCSSICRSSAMEGDTSATTAAHDGDM